MRPLFLLFSSLLSWGLVAQSSLTLEVELSKPSGGGVVRVALCAGAEAYSTEKGCRLVQGKVTTGVVHLEVKDLPEGSYAVKAFHDLNENGKMDTNMMGIPKEPYGFSNDAMGTFGPPSFEEAKFKVVKGKNVTRFRMRG